MGSDVTTLQIISLDDMSVVNLFQSIDQLLSPYPGVMEFFITDQIKIDAVSDDIRETLFGKKLIKRAYLTKNPTSKANLSVNLFRSVTQTTNGQRTRIPSANICEIDISFYSEEPFWENQAEIPFQILDLIQVATGAAIQKNDDSALLIQSVLVNLGNTSSQILSNLEMSIEKWNHERVKVLQETERREIERQQKLNEALEKLEAERQSLERQSHMAERRRLSREMTQIFRARSEKPIAPSGIQTMRWVIFAAYLLFAGAAGFFSFQNLQAIDTSNLDSGLLEWILLARGTVLAVLCLGSIALSISWLRKFYESDTKTAKESERFDYDLNRANWIIETILEVQQEKKGEIPQEWIEGVTRGMFDGDRKQTAQDAGAQALAAILGFSASASIGPDGPRFELNRRGAKRLANAVEAED